MLWPGEVLEVAEGSENVRRARRAGMEELDGTEKCRTRGRRGGIVVVALFNTGERERGNRYMVAVGMKKDYCRAEGREVS